MKSVAAASVSGLPSRPSTALAANTPSAATPSRISVTENSICSGSRRSARRSAALGSAERCTTVSVDWQVASTQATENQNT